MVWRWNWREEFCFGDEDESSTEITVIPETQVSECSSSDGEKDSDEDGLLDVNASMITHTVTFKCIGCTKEQSYQETLAAIAQIQNRGEVVTCKIVPEPNNPVNAKAIAIKCKVDEIWCTVGYIVREALKEVHEALQKNEIIGVSINWVKFVIYWKKPGWYAGVSIKRVGEWSHTVLSAQSAKN